MVFDSEKALSNAHGRDMLGLDRSNSGEACD